MGTPNPNLVSSSGPPPQVFCSSSRNGWIQGLRVTPLRWPLQPQPSHHGHSGAWRGPSGAALPLSLQLPEELRPGRRGAGPTAGSRPSHPNRAQAAGPHDLRRNRCHFSLYPPGCALVHPGARLLPWLGQPGFFQRQGGEVSIGGGGSTAGDPLAEGGGKGAGTQVQNRR